jgi:Domain of unknown function (DUF1929)/Glyoxal oxidase N-terminus
MMKVEPPPDAKAPAKGPKLHGVELEPKIHRRILYFLNSATRPEDLVFAPRIVEGHEDFGRVHEHIGDEVEEAQEPILEERLARTVFETRESNGPYGFLDLRELVEVRGFNRGVVDRLLHLFGPATYGRWDTLPYDTQQPNGTSVDVGHAALLHTGKVLFIPADYSSQGWPTPIWDPSDETMPQFECPTVNPDYALFCGGHSFLSDGKLLVVGGGGDRNVTPGAVWGFKFDPTSREWKRTDKPMSEYRWYPTTVTLGDRRVIVTCGSGSGHMEAYSETNDRFDEITGDTRFFPNLYPGLHLLPNHSLFYSRTGWGSAGAGGATNDNQSAYFSFSTETSGAWTSIVAASPNRAKGMSVLILQPSYPYARVLVVGGVDMSGNGLNTAETIDVSMPSPTSAWNPPVTLPDAELRRQCNTVLLPDGMVFVSGGISRVNSPCTLFNPEKNVWSPMDELPSIRGYHSVSILLPSGKVLVAGGDGNPRIEVFSPPYLFRGSRPQISSSPGDVRYRHKFMIESPNVSDIDRVTLVRPMAVTHQTDTEQRVIELSFKRLGHNKVRAEAPDGAYPHSLAPQGYYMLFVLDGNGTPSLARWIYLH